MNYLEAFIYVDVLIIFGSVLENAEQKLLKVRESRVDSVP